MSLASHLEVFELTRQPKRATKPHADMYMYTPIESALKRLTYERYVYNIPMASSLRGFLADHEVFEVSRCQKTKRQ
ncbi:MAG: hypothetical protein EGQ96_05150 [Prevotella sp.]|nr:hypothetical protein [Prevotella sp.]